MPRAPARTASRRARSARARSASIETSSTFEKPGCATCAVVALEEVLGGRSSSSPRSSHSSAAGSASPSRSMPARRTSSGSSPSVSASGAASRSGLTKTNGPHVSTASGHEAELRRVEAGLALGARRRAQRAVEVVRPGVVRALERLALPSPSTSSEPRWRQTLRNARSSPSRSRTSTIGTPPASQATYAPASATAPVWPTYCHARRKIRSCSSRSTAGSEYQSNGIVGRRRASPSGESSEEG